MKGKEFLDRLKVLGKKREKEGQGGFVVKKVNRGKGSHQGIYLADSKTRFILLSAKAKKRQTTIKDMKKELPSGLLSKMCKDLDVTKKELMSISKKESLEVQNRMPSEIKRRI